MQNPQRCVYGMKIIPLETDALKEILRKGMTYRKLYPMLEESFQSELLPHEWYEQMIKDPLSQYSQ